MDLTTWLLTGLGILGFLALLLVATQYRGYRFYKAQGVPCLPFRPLIGNLKEQKDSRVVGFTQYVTWLYNKYGDKNYSYVPVFGPRIAFSTPQAAKDLLVTNNHLFTKSQQLQVVLGPLLGKGLLLSSGELHNKQRRLVAPAFHFSNLRNMMPAISATMAAACDRWLNDTMKTGSQELEMHERLSAATLAILGRAVFGANLELESDEMYTAMSAVLNMNEMYSLKGLIPVIRDFPTEAIRVRNGFVKKLDAFIQQLVTAERQAAQDQKERNSSCLLPMLVHAQDGGDTMSDRQVRDELTTFLLAGHETTAQLMSWTMVTLSQNPDWKAKLRQEVDTVLGSRLPTHEELHEMPILNAILNETLRLFPPACMVGRMSKERVTVDGVDCLPGTMLILSIFRLHRNPDYWEEPDKFNPARFMDGRQPAPNTFLPFSAGRRDCIGRNFALMEARVMLAMMVQRLDFDLLPSYEHHPSFFITLRPKFGVPMRIVKREQVKA